MLWLLNLVKNVFSNEKINTLIIQVFHSAYSALSVELNKQGFISFSFVEVFESERGKKITSGKPRLDWANKIYMKMNVKELSLLVYIINKYLNTSYSKRISFGEFLYKTYGDGKRLSFMHSKSSWYINIAESKQGKPLFVIGSYHPDTKKNISISLNDGDLKLLSILLEDLIPQSTMLSAYSKINDKLEKGEDPYKTIKNQSEKDLDEYKNKHKDVEDTVVNEDFDEDDDF